MFETDRSFCYAAGLFIPIQRDLFSAGVRGFGIRRNGQKVGKNGYDLNVECGTKTEPRMDANRRECGNCREKAQKAQKENQTGEVLCAGKCFFMKVIHRVFGR